MRVAVSSGRRVARRGCPSAGHASPDSHARVRGPHARLKIAVQYILNCVGTEEIKQQKQVDDLRESRGEAPSASTRHSSTALKSVPQRTSNRKEIKRENKGRAHTRTKIGKRVASTIERMGIAGS